MPRYMKQSAISDLSTHLGVKRRSIEDDVYFLCFLPGQNRFDDRFSLKKIVSQKPSRCRPQFSLFDADFFLLLCLSRTLALLFHQSLTSNYVNRKPTLPRHKLCELNRKPVGIV